MNELTLSLGWIGGAGILGSTVLFPLLARLLPSRPLHGESGMKAPPRKIEILIPAHNEEKNLPHTLGSIRECFAELRLIRPEIEITVRVGADACEDSTAHRAREHGAKVFEYPANRSKWRTLRDLTREVPPDADWIAWVDAGTLWPRSLLVHLIAALEDARLIGVAPGYAPRNAGLLEHWHWKIERRFKTWENRAGGPVSVHGATVFYRAPALRESLSHLDQLTPHELWLNDDVVIPTLIRSLNPGKTLFYVNSAYANIADLGLASDRPDYGRRRRMMLGNLQWLLWIYPICLKRNPKAGVLATRRVFRALWAYWVFLTSAAIVLTLPYPWNWASILFGLFALKRVAPPLIASLLIPYELLIRKNTGKARWS